MINAYEWLCRYRLGSESSSWFIKRPVVLINQPNRFTGQTLDSQRGKGLESLPQNENFHPPPMESWVRFHSPQNISGAAQDNDVAAFLLNY